MSVLTLNEYSSPPAKTLDAVRSPLAQLFELSRGGRNSVPAIDGLRGVAVFLVFMVHYVSQVDAWLPPGSTTLAIALTAATIGQSGVDLFFVLSGYLIYGTIIRKATPFPVYMQRRIQRIYPAFLCVLALYIVLAFYFPEERAMPSAWPALTLYIAANALLLPGLFDIPPIITVAWSLSYEAFYYLVVPLLVGVLSLRARTDKQRLLFVCVLTACAMVYFNVHPSRVRLLMFTAGIVLFELLQNPRWKSATPWGLVSLVVGLALVPLVASLPHYDWTMAMLLHASFLILCFDAFAWTTWTRRLLTFTPLRWYGSMSYSYYLIHGLTLKAGFLAFSHVVPPAGQSALLFWLLLPPMFVATLVPATLLFAFVEKPFSLGVPLAKW